MPHAPKWGQQEQKREEEFYPGLRPYCDDIKFKTTKGSI
jgi:hypothetical protein